MVYGCSPSSPSRTRSRQSLAARSISVPTAASGFAKAGCQCVRPSRSLSTTTCPWHAAPAPQPITGTVARSTTICVTSAGHASTRIMLAPAASSAAASCRTRSAVSALRPVLT